MRAPLYFIHMPSTSVLRRRHRNGATLHPCHCPTGASLNINRIQVARLVESGSCWPESSARGLAGLAVRLGAGLVQCGVKRLEDIATAFGGFGARMGDGER